MTYEDLDRYCELLDRYCELVMENIKFQAENKMLVEGLYAVRRSDEIMEARRIAGNVLEANKIATASLEGPKPQELRTQPPETGI